MSMTTSDRHSILHAYLDDSAGADASMFHCVGYLFEPEMADRFTQEWAGFLKSKDLPLFHATDTLRRSNAEEIFSTLVRLTKATAMRGCINSLPAEALESVHKSVRHFIGSAFSVSTLSCMKQIAEVAKEQKKYVVYFIEDQGEFGGELRDFLDQIKHVPAQVEMYAMADAGTYSKTEAIPLQAADLLAWSLTRSHYRGHWIDVVRELTQDRVLRHTVGSFDPIMVAMFNSFYGMRSNRARFAQQQGR
jgi:hypothetical protein